MRYSSKKRFEIVNIRFFFEAKIIFSIECREFYFHFFLVVVRGVNTARIWLSKVCGSCICCGFASCTLHCCLEVQGFHYRETFLKPDEKPNSRARVQDTYDTRAFGFIEEIEVFAYVVVSVVVNACRLCVYGLDKSFVLCCSDLGFGNMLLSGGVFNRYNQVRFSVTFRKFAGCIFPRFPSFRRWCNRRLSWIWWFEFLWRSGLFLKIP